MKCKWNGVEYPSLNQAAKALGITTQAMTYRFFRGYTSDADLDNGGHSNSNRGKNKPCSWNGIEYESVAEAARDLGITPAAMHRRLAHGCENDEDLLVDSECRSSRSCEWNGVHYPSISAASKATGMSFGAMQYRVDNGITCDEDMKRKKGVNDDYE